MRLITLILYSFTLVLSLLLGGFCFFVHNQALDFSSLQEDVDFKPTVLLDVQGKIWGKFQFDKRKYVKLEHIPHNVIQAFLATEDRDFFKHPGISFRGIVRSFFINLFRGQRAQGASTITQQLIRLKFLHTQKTFSRKLKEQFYAILVERKWSKEQILEAYINNVYFGDGIYGLQAASQRFWGIDIDQVSLDQAAALVSVMKSPRVYSPLYAPANTLKRRNLILSMMKSNQMITQQEYDHACIQPLSILPADHDQLASHAKEAIRQQLEPILGKDRLYGGGLTIQTTLHIDIQKEAERAFKDHITYLRRTMHEKVDGGLMTIDSATGGIAAMIGGYDFYASKFNRALHAHRQMGSVFKILVYAAALQQGLNFWDTDIDEPIEVIQSGTVWKPNNYNNTFLGKMTHAYGLSHSNNILTVKALLKIGTQPVIDLARKCGITARMAPYPSLALGCVDVNLKEVVGCFNVIANQGMYVAPHMILWVKDEHGNKIYKTNTAGQQVVSPVVASQIARVLMFGALRLQDIVGGNQQLLCEFFGKTGTTNDSRNCWYCGSTPEFTTGIYIGCDGHQSLGKNVYGSKTAFPIWLKLHQKIVKRKTIFYYDPQLKNVLYNWLDGTIQKKVDQEDVVPLLV